MSRQVSRGSAGEYQADEQAGVVRLTWRVSGNMQAGVRGLAGDMTLLGTLQISSNCWPGFSGIPFKNPPSTWPQLTFLVESLVCGIHKSKHQTQLQSCSHLPCNPALQGVWKSYYKPSSRACIHIPNRPLGVPSPTTSAPRPSAYS